MNDKILARAIFKWANDRWPSS